MNLKFWNKDKAPKWDNLTANQQKLVASRMIKAIRNMAGPRYKLVSGFDEYNREQGTVETGGEDSYLDAYRRGKMTDLARNAVRNSSTFNAILKQFDFNAVGTNAGKVILDWKDSEAASRVINAFAKWTRQADFFDGISLCDLMKLVCKEYTVGGDMVILYDDAMIEDSGKLVIYESDEIGNSTDEAVRSHYGKTARQSLGRVYNGNGRFIGAIVSRSQRGKSIFDPKACYFLARNPDEEYLENFWIMPRNIFRVAQGRGISQMASSLGTMIDLEDTCGFEVQAAKKNSQVIAQVLQTESKADEAIPSAFDSSTDFDSMTDDEIEEATKAEMGNQVETVTLEQIRHSGIIYQAMPSSAKIELLDTKHPNQNMPQFLEFLEAKSAAVFGLTKQFATLAVSDSDYKSQVLMTQPAFNECQKFLEQILDWAFYRWSRWAVRKSIIDANDLPENFMNGVSWQWNKIAQLDENSYQDAVAKKLTNMTGTLKDELGANYKEKLLQIKEEIKFCKDNGLPHPALQMVSGGMREEYYTETKSDKTIQGE